MAARAITIRPARLPDLDALEAIENSAFGGDRLSRKSLRYYLGSVTVDFLVLEHEGDPGGDAIVAYRRNSSAARLYTIAIRPDLAGHGYGRQLLAASEAQAQTRDRAVLRLEVRSDNAAAIRLYESAGYRRFGVYEDYYEDGAAAFRFEKALGRGCQPPPPTSRNLRQAAKVARRLP